jgi:outer membrane protein TolC
VAVLNAEQAYQQAELALIQAQASRYADTAGLFQSLGGGWWNRTEEPRYEQFGSTAQ